MGFGPFVNLAFQKEQFCLMDVLNIYTTWF